MSKFSRAAPEVPPPFPFDETRQGGVPWRADVREGVASTAWRRGRSATMAREVMASGASSAVAHTNKRRRGKDVEAQAPAQAPPSLFGIELRYLVCGMLVLQNTGAVLLMRYTRSMPGETEYMTQTAVIMQEVIKGCLLYTSPSPRDS